MKEFFSVLWVEHISHMCSNSCFGHVISDATVLKIFWERLVNEHAEGSFSLFLSLFLLHIHSYRPFTCVVWGCSKKGPSPDTTYQHLEFRLPGSRTMRNKFLFFTTYSVCSILQALFLWNPWVCCGFWKMSLLVLRSFPLAVLGCNDFPSLPSSSSVSKFAVIVISEPLYLYACFLFLWLPSKIFSLKK